MKKFIAIVSCLLIPLLGFASITTAASTEEYNIPESYQAYDIPGSNEKGMYSVTLNSSGATDPNGLYTFVVEIDTKPGEIYTKVTSWQSNFPVYAVIVKSNNIYNMYQYHSSIRGDTDLNAPDIPEGGPGNVSEVTIIYNPEEFPDVPEAIPAPKPEPWELVRNFLYRNLSILAIPLVVAFFLLGNLIGRLRPRPARTSNDTVESNTTSSLNMDNLPSPTSTNYGNNDETQLRTPSPYSRYPRNRHYDNTNQ
ncbi:MAG: hypothetical protein GX359_11055 [Clostridiales bacterium]|nr:hypothetical protein [Clostridiales bacterium]